MEEKGREMKILICDSFDSSLPEKLSCFGEVTENHDHLPEADIALVRSKTKCTREWLNQAKNLKMIIRGGVGLDNVDQVAAQEKNIIVANTAEASSISVAELAMALMLTIPCRLIQGHNGMLEGKWLKKECKRTELYTKTLGLVGMGRIAEEVAIRAKAFCMRVIACARSPKETDLVEMVSFEELCAQSDYISLHIPSTPENLGFINEKTIAKMKPGVILINTARGECIVEEDVVAALKSGQIGAYGTDVWMSDPPKGSPIEKAPNVVMTPHIGGSSDENLLRIGESIEKQIAAFLAG